MLSDRDYMRSEPAGGFRPSKPMSATVIILVINAAVFLLQGAFGRNPAFYDLFSLSVEGLKHGFVWEFITYQFMHGSLIHILFNSWGIWVFGRVVEQALGRRRFVFLYLSSGVAGGLLQVIAALSWSRQFGGSVVGASAGLFGLIAAFATMFPHQSLMLIFPPVSLRAKSLLLIFGLLAAVGIVFPKLVGGNIAHAAHLGGMLAGILYIRQLRHKLGHWPGEPPRPRRRPLFGFGSGKPSEPGGPTIIDVDEVSDDYVANEVDPILEKISRHGIHSLTARERKTLEEARRKMGPR